MMSSMQPITASKAESAAEELEGERQEKSNVTQSLSLSDSQELLLSSQTI